MAGNDWNPDDFLDFDYSSKGSDNKISKSEYDEYLSSRKPKQKPAATPTAKNEKVKRQRVKPSKHTDEEKAALKQAQQEANDRYLSNFDKNYKRKYGRKKASKPLIWITRIYLAVLAVFGVVMAIMDVLPIPWLIAIFVLLIIISILLLTKMQRGGKKRYTKPLATLLTLVLIFVYGLGTAYALGTLSFLSSTSVNNDKNVAVITRNPFNVVITGMDVDGKIDEQGRSDVNMVLTVNPKTAQLLMTSIPRDYQIYMPDKDMAMDKLTHTGFYSVETTILAEEDLLDITANYYVKVNFTTIEKFVDAVGGIDVYSEYEFTPVKLKSWTVHEGMNHMNGKQALAFARERKAFEDGDRQRIKNQQAVFEALFKKATSSKTMILHYNNVLTQLRDYFEMSFSSREVRSLVKMQISKNPSWSIYKNTITGGDGMLPTYTAGGEYSYVMTQDEESINNAKTLINAVLNGDELVNDEEGNPELAEEISEE